MLIDEMSFAFFDWDDGNREKCRKHGVSLTEIESALMSGAFVILPDFEHSDQEDRLIATGQAENGRHLFVAFTLREINGQGHVRPISARYMHKKEADRYEEARAELAKRR